MLAPAEQELLDAAAYYETQATGLGYQFLLKVESAITDITNNPKRWPLLRFDIRRRLVQRFPYGVLYKIDPECIVIVAVMHLRRHPDYWIERIHPHDKS